MDKASLTIDLTKASPMMVQWHECKQRSPGCVLLFRMGDFYEAFYEDAALLSRELDLTLTSRQEIPMSGIPVHTSDNYIDKLVAKGFRVAVAEQLEDPKQVKGLVKRDVVRIVTPGTLLHSHNLEEKAHNFFTCLVYEKPYFGLAFVDLTTGGFWASEWEEESALFNELHRLQPAECLTSLKFEEKHQTSLKEMKQSFSCLFNAEEEWFFYLRKNRDFLLDHFRVHQLDGFGLGDKNAVIRAAGALLAYLKDRLSLSINHIRDIESYSSNQYMAIDRMTQRNLEISRSLKDGSRSHTLLAILDETATSMGGRLMQQWLKQPLLSIGAIHARQEALKAFLESPAHLVQIKTELAGVRDLERLMGKISSGYATPRDLAALLHSFPSIAAIKTGLAPLLAELIQKNLLSLHPLPDLHQQLKKALLDSPPAKLGEGPLFREGFHRELDELYHLAHDGKSWMAQYQTAIREQTGIKTLKVGFNKMFGYYIEVSRGQSEKMPMGFIRRQTLSNAERYITPELKEYESRVFSAEERIQALERSLFEELRQEVLHYLTPILQIAKAIAEIDCLACLADLAKQREYTCPLVDESLNIEIREGRHPVIESACLRERFIPNDTMLNETEQLLLITGPNMAGKSTYLRQVALIVLMAQMGSYVPAKQARIGIVDKLFTRIGASDDLSRGQSTFMVEMSETAYILHHATHRSLVILDEIGRGTGTTDGISIAWAVAEFLLTSSEKAAKTLFATHYWELTKLEEKIPGAVNYHLAIHDAGDRLIFLRKLVRGGTDKSYGIHVASLAGMPPSVIQRAREISAHLEATTSRENPFERTAPTARRSPKIKPLDLQLSLFN